MRTGIVAAATGALCVGALWLALLYGTGDPDRDGASAARDAAIDLGQPELVVAGHSITRTSVDPAQLSALTGRRAALLTLDGADAATWHALLDRHVWSRGHEPPLIIVVSGASHALGTAAERPRHAIDRGGTSPFDRVLRGRAFARTDLAHAARSGAARLVSLTGPSLPGSMARMEAATAAWLADPARVDLELAGPGFFERGVRPADPEALIRLVDAAMAHDAAILFVLPPRREPELESPILRELIARQPNAELLDLTDLAMPDDWLDGTHPGPLGQAAITRAIADALTRP